MANEMQVEEFYDWSPPKNCLSHLQNLKLSLKTFYDKFEVCTVGPLWPKPIPHTITSSYAIWSGIVFFSGKM